MPFIRLSDDYNDHPKFAHLSDGAFRLWHQGMGFCRKYQTDGVIPTASLRDLKAYSPKRMRDLMTPWREGENPLWHPVDGVGVKVHDYLQWNPSKDEENERRAESKERMRQLRERRYQKGVPPVRDVLQRNTVQTSAVTSHEVLGVGRKGIALEEEEVSERAGRLLQDDYPAWYAKYRDGARLPLIPSHADFQKAQGLCRTWDDARLEKLAKIVLTTNEDWIAATDRSFKIFAARAAWADDRLRQWEKEHDIAV